MQISAMSFTLTYPLGFVYLEFSWTLAPSVFSSIEPYLPVAIAVFFYYLEYLWGGAAPPLSSGTCHTLATATSFPLSKFAGQVPPLLPSLASLYIYSSSGECPSPTLWSSGIPTLFVTCLFFSFFSAACLLFSLFFLLFFPWVGVSLSRGYADLAEGCLGSTMCCLAHLVVCVSQAGLKLASGGEGTLLVSPFNVDWGCYVQAGGMEVSEFCLFLMVFPARCISSISPRFYFRKRASCFLPLVAILDSLSCFLKASEC
jgi:hypothetical protein